MAGVSADNARIAEAIEVIRAEWRRMAEGGVTADELEKTKRYLTGAYPLRFDSNAKIASMLAAIQHAGLGVDYIDRRNDLVEAVTQEDVARVAKRLLHDDRLRIVVVGQPVGITTN
jgi:zinc protease